MNLKEKLDKLLGNDYGELKPVIIEIFLIYQEKFEYSDDEIIEECKNLQQFLHFIEFQKNFSRNSNVVGTADYYAKKMIIHEDFVNEEYKELKDYIYVIAVFIHEIVAV